MGGVISVVTAVHAPAARFLPEAYASLLRQELPEGWRWQWVVQEDGRTDAVAGVVARAAPGDARVSFGQGRRGGPGVARTMALSRVEGEYVKVLDADDMLTPGALARDLAALTSHPDVSWATSRGVDLLPDGTTRGFEDDPPEGPLEPGTLYAYWKAHDFRSRVIPGTLFVRRDLLLSLGGWMALPASEDTGLMMALDAVSRGWFTGETGMIYRKWPGQSTRQAAHTDRAEWEARMAVIEARALALAVSTAGPRPGPDNADPNVSAAL